MSAAPPNPSLKLSPNGGPRGPGRRYAVRGTFSPTGPARPTVGASLARTLGVTSPPCPSLSESNTKSARSWTAKPPLGIASTPIRWLICSIQTRFGHGRRTPRHTIRKAGSCLSGDLIVHDGRQPGSHCFMSTNSYTTSGERFVSKSQKSTMVPLQLWMSTLCGATRKQRKSSTG